MINFKSYSKYSIKHSIADISDIVESAKNDGDSHAAVLDKGNLHSTIYLAKECAEHGIKPILGYELTELFWGYTFWPLNNDGLRELNKISTKFSDLTQVRDLSQFDLTNIVLIVWNREPLDFWTDFKSENRYLGLSLNEPIDNQLINDVRKWAKQYKCNVIAGSDVLYNERKDAMGHDYFHNYVHGDGQHLLSDDFYIKTRADFDKMPFTKDEITNINKLANRINLTVELNKLKFPAYDAVPKGETIDRYLYGLCLKTLHDKRLTSTWIGNDAYEERLDYEMADIVSAGLESYFLIVKDICDFAKKNGIKKGDGRGSAAGSLVCYLLGITGIDPLQYGLIWERFYNIGRKGSLPDIDTDIEAERRDEVLKYISERFGADKVYQIITFGTLGPKKAIKAALSLAGCSFEEQNKVTDLIWHKAESIDEAITHSVKFKEEADRRHRLFNVAKQYEGAIESFGKHAAGVIIAKEPYLDGGLPMMWHPDDKEFISGYDLGAVESYGLLKIDVLGLNTLNIIKRCEQLIKERHGIDFHIENINLEDKTVYENIFHTGKTKGVFQLESQLGQKYSELLKPNNITEIADLVTVVRPGAMVSGQTDKYLKVRGGEKAEYPHPKLESVLKDTYSACIYQEQVIKICTDMAGMDLQKADKVRAAAGKKKKKDMDAMQSEFIAGCLKEGHSKELADTLWSWVVEFSGYSFNKSHAVCYAYCAYQTAYLKHYYPVEFYEASCNYVKGDLHRSEFDKLKEIINDAKLFDITITVPSIKYGNKKFAIINDKTIVYGLTMIKGVGEASADLILQCKDCVDFNSFLDKANQIGLKKNVVHGLICSGALDHFKITRNQMLMDCELLENLTEKESKEVIANLNIKSIYDSIELLCKEINVSNRKQSKLFTPNIKRREKLRNLLVEYDNKDKFESIYHLAVHEREFLGVEISINEADNLGMSMSHTCLETKSLPKNTPIRLVVRIDKIKLILTKKGKNPGQEMAFLTAGDGTYTLDNIVVFPRQYTTFRPMLTEGRIVVINGIIGETGGIIANEIALIK